MDRVCMECIVNYDKTLKCLKCDEREDEEE